MFKNILILTPHYPPNIGGAETFCEGLVKEITKCHKVTVLTFQPFVKKVASKESFSNLTIYRMRWFLKLQKVWKGTGLIQFFMTFPQMVVTALILCVRNRFDIIHAQGLISGLVAILLKKAFKVKVFITLLALYEFNKWVGFKRNIANFIFYNCDMLFVEGDGGLKDISGMKLNFSRIRIFNHWVDQSIFVPPDKRDNQKIRILFVGRPIPEKGKHIVEEAERIINDKEKYEFTYIENVDYSELPDIYRRHHIVVVPSLYAEGFSRVVAEASSCGCQIIASDKGSLREMVSDSGIGTLFNPRWEGNPDGTPYADGLAYTIGILYPMFSGSKEANNLINKRLARAKELFSSKNARVFLDEYSSN